MGHRREKKRRQSQVQSQAEPRGWRRGDGIGGEGPSRLVMVTSKSRRGSLCHQYIPIQRRRFGSRASWVERNRLNWGTIAVRHLLHEA